MTDTVMTIMIAGIETLLIPAIYRWLKAHIKRRWLVFVLLIFAVLLTTMIIGTVVSVVMSTILRSE